MLQIVSVAFATNPCFLGLWLSRVRWGGSSSSSLWEPEPPYPTWDWLHQTWGQCPAFPVSTSLLGHLEASQESESTGTASQVLFKAVDFLALFSLETIVTGVCSRQRSTWVSLLMSHPLCFLKQSVSLARNSQGSIVIVNSGDSCQGDPAEDAG